MATNSRIQEEGKAHGRKEHRRCWVLSTTEASYAHAWGAKTIAAVQLDSSRQVTLNLLKLDTSVKAGIKNKRKTCGWSEEYMMKVLGLINL